MNYVVGLDFETYSEVDIAKHGVDRYVSDPSFRVLIAATYTHDLNGHAIRKLYDFINVPKSRDDLFLILDAAKYITAHNVSFEAAVLRAVYGLCAIPATKFIDSAAIARREGASSSLAAAASQLLGLEKMPEGKELIRKFSIPQPGVVPVWDPARVWTLEDSNGWSTFCAYCIRDAELSWKIVDTFGMTTSNEHAAEAITLKMNLEGWPVDVASVEEMQRQYEDNLLEVKFRWLAQMQSAQRWLPDEKQELNFNSTPQLTDFCMRRGVNIKSFDKDSVEKNIYRLQVKLKGMPFGTKYGHIVTVIDMLRTKEELGGSSLSKLQTILDQVGPDGRLRYQYMHCGAGQSWRTSGRGVQMQNLKRLGTDSPEDLDSILSRNVANDVLASNLRQVFKAPGDSQIIVGDFSAVESRGLAFLANEEWVLEAYERGEDIYKSLATKMFHVHYDDVTKQQRQGGKVGQLSCGYGAGPGAVATFAEKMGIEMTEEEAQELVSNWRTANPKVVELWGKLDEAFRNAVRFDQEQTVHLHSGNRRWAVYFAPSPTPDSILALNPGAKNITMVLTRGGVAVLRRVFTGVYTHGRDMCYMKPSSLVNGPLWQDVWRKNGQSGRYKIYGGKLTGILVQSFCREIFFKALINLDAKLAHMAGIKIIGQFHDEIVLEATSMTAEMAELTLSHVMCDRPYEGFPMNAEVHSAQRYIK